MSIAQSTVGMWEAGRRTPKLAEINRLAKALDITVARLIGSHQPKIEITKNEVYVDGKKLDDLETTDINMILENIRDLRENKKNEPVPVQPRVPNSAKKILVIDDEQEMCETLYSFLAPQNYKVFLTFNGQMGLEYFGEIQPDLILLDLGMPDIDGIDVLRIIRKISDIPVVIITANPGDIADIHLENLHIEGYIEKPFSLQLILNTIKHILGG